MSKRICTMLAAVVALAAVAAGCGGDGDDREALTKAQYVKQTDRICERANEKTRAEFTDFVRKAQAGKGSMGETEKVAEKVVLPNLEAKVEELNELEPPSEDEAQVSAWLDALDEAVDEAKKDPASLINLSLAGDYPLLKASKLARAYGLEACGSG